MKDSNQFIGGSSGGISCWNKKTKSFKDMLEIPLQLVIRSPHSLLRSIIESEETEERVKSISDPRGTNFELFRRGSKATGGAYWNWWANTKGSKERDRARRVFDSIFIINALHKCSTKCNTNHNPNSKRSSLAHLARRQLGNQKLFWI